MDYLDNKEILEQASIGNRERVAVVVESEFYPDGSQSTWSTGYYDCPRCGSNYTYYISIIEEYTETHGWYCEECFLLWEYVEVSDG